MPTLHFLVYLLVVAGAYFFRLSYLGWFGPYLVWCVISVPLFLFLVSLPSMIDLKIRLHAQPYITKKTAGRLIIRFESTRFLPLSKVKIWIEIENRFAGEVYRERYVFRSLGNNSMEIPLHTELCGQLYCKVTRLECRDILGLFAIRKKNPALIKCAVVPPAIPPENTVNFDALLNAQAFFKPKYGGGYSEEHELREYRPGDTANSIHWKLSSKTDTVIVREPLEQENNEIYLVLSRVGLEDRGLEVLYWLSLELYRVGNESEAAEAMAGILSVPITEPVRFDESRARCIFRVSSGEVRTK